MFVKALESLFFFVATMYYIANLGQGNKRLKLSHTQEVERPAVEKDVHKTTEQSVEIAERPRPRVVNPHYLRNPWYVRETNKW